MVRRTYKKPHRAKKRKSIFAKAAFWRSAFFVVAIGGSVWLVCFSPALEVKEINVAGTQKINGDDCAKFIEEEVNKKIAFLDSKSILLFNLDQTKKEILAKFPQIQDIKIKREFPSKIYASIEERRGVAVLAAGNGKRYLVDTDGIVFEETAENPPGLLQIAAGRAQDLQVGNTAIEKELLSSILRMKGDVQSTAEITVTGAVLATPERVNLQTSEGWYVYFNPIKDTDSQLLKLGAVMTDETFKAKRSNLEYVDIRFTRVYLKEKSAVLGSGINLSGSASSTEE
jgi:hypothetical protein